MSLNLQFGMCSDGRSVATPVSVSCYDIRFCIVDSAPWRTNLQPRDSVVVNRKRQDKTVEAGPNPLYTPGRQNS